MKNKIYSDKEALEIYKEILDGKRKGFPPMFKNNLHLLRTIAKYLFEEILNYSLNDIYENLTEDLLIKYKIVNIVKRYFKSHYEFIKFVYPDKKVYPWLFKLGTRNYIQNDEIVKEAIEWLIEKYNITINDVYQGKISKSIFKENKLESILTKRFNGSIKKYFEWYYNNFTNEKFNIELSKHKFPNYYNKEKYINLIREYFISLGFDENDFSYENKDIIIKNFNRELLYEKFSCNIYKVVGKTNYEIFKSAFPNYPLFQWELIASKGFWNVKENRIQALKELIMLNNLTKEEIPKFLNYDNLKQTRFSKFNRICDQYYDCDYFNWVNEAFPNEFSFDDFHPNRVLHDGYKMHSLKEAKIHDILKEIFKKVIYVENGNKDYYFYNELHNEGYYPDWIVDDNIIVEYFGWYEPDNNDDKIKSYTEKANRKIAFYSKLKEYKFLPLFPNCKLDAENIKSYIR